MRQREHPVNQISRNLLDPSTIEGALVYAALVAVVRGVLVHRTSRRLSARAPDDLERGRIAFTAQIVSVIAYAHPIPSLRATAVRS